MPDPVKLQGVIAAAVTPLQSDFRLAFDDLPGLIDFLARRGCHGVLLLGTTGEGPSFSSQERVEWFRWANSVRQSHPDLKLIAGTGTPSLEETIHLNRKVFDIGLDGVVVLPPYYFRKASQEGLFAWFSQVISKSAPADGVFLLYHIPGLTGVTISYELIARLRDAFPDLGLGIKDSTADGETARQLGERFGKDLLTFSGTDSLFDLALEHFASGCITAMANLRSPDLRLVWEARQRCFVDEAARSRLVKARAIMDRYPPNPPLYKAMLSRLHGFPRWAVRPPLLPIDSNLLGQIILEALSEVDGFGE